MRAAPVRRDAGRQLVTHGDRARRHIRRIAGRHIAGVAHRQRVLGTGLAIIPDAAGGIVALHHLQRRRGDGDPVVLNLAVVGHAGRVLDLDRVGGVAQAHVAGTRQYLGGHGPGQSIQPATLPLPTQATGWLIWVPACITVRR
ncbi:hypothetical protein G6F68_017705 [Rhizopus microsporus]|nr:hypothetical protein G6F68_017705 [Rhizopus microsporus]